MQCERPKDEDAIQFDPEFRKLTKDVEPITIKAGIMAQVGTNHPA